MNKNYTEIAFVLDRSGSMQSCRDAALEGFNHFLREQQAVEGLARLTLVLFDDEYLVPFRSLPVAEIVPLTTDTYLPRASTALLDAIAQTILELGEQLAALPEAERPAQVIVAVLTDGLENASRNYTWAQVAQLIRQQTEQYRWTFLFLGANQDAIATAAQLSIAAANAANYVADDIGMQAMHTILADKVGAMRKRAIGSATLQEQAIAEAPMSELLKEDDRRKRGH